MVRVEFRDNDIDYARDGCSYDAAEVVADAQGFTVTVTGTRPGARAMEASWRWDEWDWCNVPSTQDELRHMASLVLDWFRYPIPGVYVAVRPLKLQQKK